MNRVSQLSIYTTDCLTFLLFLSGRGYATKLTPPCVRGRRVCARASAAAGAPVRKAYNGEVIHS